uniref:Uncharacterized protein n=1 Tax=Corethron hystrix TaxID=216773 RepID=A0A7S1FT42_9STRA|mmetsp:Transcript_26806/g.61712  ORF Transcript_26806/g.61712 Transcript_26806/m.61712 type:complete len:109 (+) Transcript_26806:211-537(+)
MIETIDEEGSFCEPGAGIFGFNFNHTTRPRFDIPRTVSLGKNSSTASIAYSEPSELVFSSASSYSDSQDQKPKADYVQRIKKCFPSCKKMKTSTFPSFNIMTMRVEYR